jgi:2-polyprenyl-3-methyl-5-hydroxy-6-metoxy-1,4-benzoquinol methylase
MQITKIINEYVSLQKVTLLDVGCNTGIFMNFINKDVRNIYGIEPSIEAALYAQNQGLDVQNGIIANCTYPEGIFDVITMWDVIEHLSNPLEDLKKICSWLNPNGHGTIFISTHDINSLFARMLGKQYPMLMYQHFFHYSPLSLTKMLEKSGFRIIGTHKIQKSWSIKYLHNLAIKLWPNSILVKLITRFTKYIPDDSYIGKLQITFPMKDFFVLVAVKA